jgi:hypothetical protein
MAGAAKRSIPAFPLTLSGSARSASLCRGALPRLWSFYIFSPLPWGEGGERSKPGEGSVTSPAKYSHFSSALIHSAHARPHQARPRAAAQTNPG